jgi:hypothetical protein
MMPKYLWTLLAIFLAVSAVFAQQTRVSERPARHPLPPAVVAQHERLQRLLPPSAKQRVEQLVPDYRGEIMKLPAHADLQKLAESKVRTKFPKVSPSEARVLTFALLKQTADSLSDMSQSNQLELQMAMDRKSQLEAALSNMLKSIEDTQDAVVQNLK